MPKNKWKIILRGHGHECTILRNGELFTECERVVVDAKAGELTKIILYLVDTELDIELEAVEKNELEERYPFCLTHDQGRKAAPCYCGRPKSWGLPTWAQVVAFYKQMAQLSTPQPC